MINFDKALFWKRQDVSTETKGNRKNLYQYLKNLLNINNTDHLFFSQNSSTNLAFFLKALNKKNIPIYISSHEIIYFKTLLKTGHMPISKVSRPDFAKIKPVRMDPCKIVEVFEPQNILNLKKGKKIIIISHVSRITGEILFNKNKYRELKKSHDCIVIVDAAQSVGAMEIKADDMADVLLGVNSKFIGASPHIGFCYIKKTIEQEYNIKPWSIDKKDFENEILSTEAALEVLRLDPEKVSNLRKYLKEKLDSAKIEYLKSENQSHYFLIIKEENPLKRSYLIRDLRNRGIKTSSNTNWSIREPKYPGIRITLGYENTRKEIDEFIEILIKIKKQIAVVSQ